jgi:hypothetical protein
MELDQRDRIVQPRSRVNRQAGGVLPARWDERADQAKPFSIAKREVWEALKRVKGGDFVMMWSVLSGAGFSLNVTTRSVRTDAGWRVSRFKETKDK